MPLCRCTTPLVLALLLILPPLCQAEAGSARHDPAADPTTLTGKVLSIATLESESQGGIVIMDATLTSIRGRIFLLGTVAKGVPGLMGGGRTTWVALDSIRQIIAYDSVEDLKEDMEQAMKEWRDHYPTGAGR